MGHIIDYSGYISYSDSYYDLPHKDPILNERYGVPQILKSTSENIFREIESSIKIGKSTISVDVDESFSTNGDEYNKPIVFDFKTMITINIIYEDKVGIYATSKYVPPGINIHFNTQNYDKYELRKVVLHELLHIYEVYLRMKNETNKDLEWSINSILIKMRGNYNDDFIKALCYNIYLSFNHEINARVCETYIVLMDLLSVDKGKRKKKIYNMDLSYRSDKLISEDRSILLQELEKTTAWKYKNELNQFNYKNYKINYIELSRFLKELNREIGGKLKNKDTTNKVFRIPENNKECDIILKEWSFIFKKKSKYFEKKLIKVIDDVILDVKLINNTIINEKGEFIRPKDLLRQSKINKLIR